MRKLILVAGVLFFATHPASAQQKAPIVKVEAFRVGFGRDQFDDVRGRYKVGMWTPVYVKLKAGPNGIRPKHKDDQNYIQVETPDSEDVVTVFKTPFTMEPNEERTIVTYARTGKFGGVDVTVHVGDLQPFKMPIQGFTNPLDLNAHLYLSLGERIPDLQLALQALAPKQQQGQQQFRGQPDQDQKNTWPRYAGAETDANLLPEHWWAYQGVDLMFLSTRDKDFLLNLAKDNDASRARLKAISQWVRRGGRLVVHVSPRNQDVLHQLLTSTVWQPPLPVVPPREGTIETRNLTKLAEFARINATLTAVKEPFKVAVLQPAKTPPAAWEVLAALDDNAGPGAGKPLIARMPYGLGNVTYLALPLDDAPFTTWTDPRGDNPRVAVLKQLLGKLAPRINPNIQENEHWAGQQGNADLSSELQRSLDQFDVRIIPFGYVALFIVLYIIIVGPLDFLVLKYGFKRLEWTWFTFPTVVIAVSIAAYYTAYAIKGNDLKINKVDIVDIDLRTHLDAKGQAKKASIYGQSFFTILSPRIQNYTVGVEPNPAFWGEQAPDPLSADTLTWLGRADAGFGGMGARGGGQGFFRKPYSYNDDASGLKNVPIPVWTTKSFHAGYEVQGVTPPFEVDLQYHEKVVAGKDLRIAGKLTSKLPIDLENVWLIYWSKAYPIEGGLPKGSVKELALALGQGKSLGEWATASAEDHRPQTAQGAYNPGGLVRQMLFNDYLDNTNSRRNHALRTLDLTWRLQDDGGLRDREDRWREAIIVARVKFASGDAESLTADVNNPLPANVWLGALPGEVNRRPELAGILLQDTFVRIIVPVRPGS